MFVKLYLPLSVVIIFFLTACQENYIPKFIPKSIEKIHHLFDNNDSNNESSFIKEERINHSDVPDIYGIYNLIEGSYSYGVKEMLKKEKIKASTIVIEKLSETEFGFYYVTELKNSLINQYFGGFTYKDGKFYQKIIDYPTTNTILRDNIKLSKKGNLLRLSVESIDEQRTILWGRSKRVTPSLSKKIEEEKNNYIMLYKNKLFNDSK